MPIYNPWCHLLFVISEPPSPDLFTTFLSSSLLLLYPPFSFLTPSSFLHPVFPHSSIFPPSTPLSLPPPNPSAPHPAGILHNQPTPPDTSHRGAQTTRGRTRITTARSGGTFNQVSTILTLQTTITPHTPNHTHAPTHRSTNRHYPPPAGGGR